jgi:hypothetical protein
MVVNSHPLYRLSYRGALTRNTNILRYPRRRDKSSCRAERKKIVAPASSLGHLPIPYREARVRIHYGVALKLVGWYLMLPPLVSPGQYKSPVDTAAPLSHWHFYDERFGTDPEGWKMRLKCALVLDSKADCEAKLRRELNEIQKLERERLTRRDMTVSARIWSQAKCVSSDDPRLKLK